MYRLQPAEYQPRAESGTLYVFFQTPVNSPIYIAVKIVYINIKCELYFRQPGTGRAIVLLVGGAAEALDANPNNKLKVALRGRMGFVRIAITNG